MFYISNAEGQISEKCEIKQIIPAPDGLMACFDSRYTGYRKDPIVVLALVELWDLKYESWEEAPPYYRHREVAGLTAADMLHFETSLPFRYSTLDGAKQADFVHYLYKESAFVKRGGGRGKTNESEARLPEEK